MTNSGEAESRAVAVAGAVRGAIGQARLDAGVNITGLLVDMGSAESIDYRQHFMCWQLTRVLRPSLSEKVAPAVVRSVVEQDAARSRTGFLSGGSWRAGSPLSDLLWMHLHGEVPTASAKNSEDTDVVDDTAGAELLHPRPGQAMPETGRCRYARDSIIPSGFTDTTNVSPRQELCRTIQRACA
jgi:hypothetical protein